MSDKTVPVTLPEFAWGRLATIADHRNTTIAQLIADGIRVVLETDQGRLQQLTAEVKKHKTSKKVAGSYRRDNA